MNNPILINGVPIALIATTLLLSIYIYLSIHSSNELKQEYCTTKSCISYANSMLQNMNTSVDPCESFYDFSCGSLLSTYGGNVIRQRTFRGKYEALENTKEAISVELKELLVAPVNAFDSKSVVNLKKYFASCINQTSIEKYSEQEFLRVVNTELGGWSMLQNSTYRNDYDLVDKSIKVAKYGASPFFDIYNSIGLNNPTVIVIYVDPLEGPPIELLNSTDYLNTYADFIAVNLRMLTNSSRDFAKQISDIIELNKKIQMCRKDIETITIDDTINMTIRNLQQTIPKFPWKMFWVDGLFKDLPNVNLTEDDVLYLTDIEYFRKVADIYEDYSKNNQEALENYIMWRFYLKKVFPQMSKRYKQTKVELDKLVSGSSTEISPYQFCYNIMYEDMTFVVGQMYVNRYFNSEANKQANEMTQYLIEEFIALLKESSWMDQKSKKSSIAKAKAITKKIGYPDFLNNNTHIDTLYNFDVVPDQFLKNYLNISKYRLANYYKRAKTNINKLEWLETEAPTTVNGFYYIKTNQIIFSAGILRPPFYDSSVPNFINYGAIGSVIGHEITHGFDEKGRFFDKKGEEKNKNSLLTQKTIKRYNKKAQCMIDQYSTYASTIANRSLDGDFTLGENIADNGGINIAFRAYKKWTQKNGKEKKLPGLDFTEDQMFFISFGQILCSKMNKEELINQVLTGEQTPGEFRVLGATSNLPEFSKAFNCKPEQKNNPTKKCKVW